MPQARRARMASKHTSSLGEDVFLFGHDVGLDLFSGCTAVATVSRVEVLSLT